LGYKDLKPVRLQAGNRKREDYSDMGREQMRNLEISKLGANQVNEFEYQKHQGEISEQEHPGQQGGGKKQTQAERVAQVIAAAHRKVEKKRKKEGAKSASRKTPAAKRKSKK
jgi:hypothetical protein